MASKQQTIFWGSSFDRGLDILLYIWPDILDVYPDAVLHITYGWDLFDKAFHNNPERQVWKRNMVSLMNQKGIVYHGRVGKQELKSVRQQCGIWAYPTYFQEINCITALECQMDGVVPVVMELAALKETVQSGIKVRGDIRNPEIVKQYTKELINMMGDKKLWKKESKKAKSFAKDYVWPEIAGNWESEFQIAQKEPLVTIYTPTIREGFWNIMADNLSNQTYKNFEWIVVDDHKDNRANLMQEVCEMYGITNYTYTKGKKRKTKRTYSLANANNTAIKAAKGSLFVFLQDFVLMPHDGIEKLVDVYLKHPDCFIAPVDKYYKPSKKPNTKNSFDWFDGDVDVVGDYLRRNIRVKGEGIRYTDTVTDFEQNYGAVPTAILRDLGGYYEFFDEALGFDDTEIIFRAFKKGYRMIIDDGNIATCLDHWGVVGNNEGGINRTRRMNNPRFVWMTEKIKRGELPIVRTQEIDDQIDLQYEIPEEVSDEEAENWMKDNLENIVKGWL